MSDHFPAVVAKIDHQPGGLLIRFSSSLELTSRQIYFPKGLELHVLMNQNLRCERHTAVFKYAIDPIAEAGSDVHIKLESEIEAGLNLAMGDSIQSNVNADSKDKVPEDKSEDSWAKAYLSKTNDIDYSSYSTVPCLSWGEAPLYHLNLLKGLNDVKCRTRFPQYTKLTLIISAIPDFVKSKVLLSPPDLGFRTPGEGSVRKRGRPLKEQAREGNSSSKITPEKKKHKSEKTDKNSSGGNGDLGKTNKQDNVGNQKGGNNLETNKKKGGCKKGANEGGGNTHSRGNIHAKGNGKTKRGDNKKGGAGTTNNGMSNTGKGNLNANVNNAQILSSDEIVVPKTYSKTASDRVAIPLCPESSGLVSKGNSYRNKKGKSGNLSLNSVSPIMVQPKNNSAEQRLSVASATVDAGYEGIRRNNDEMENLDELDMESELITGRVDGGLTPEHQQQVDEIMEHIGKQQR